MELQLKTLRKNAGYTQEAFAKKINTKLPTYRTWEQGKVPFTIEKGCEIADILGCSLDELCGRWEYVKSPSFSDPRQTRLNEEFEALTDSMKDAAVAAVHGMRLDVCVRGEEEGNGSREGIGA